MPVDPRDAEITRLTASAERETEQRKAAEAVIAAQIRTITALEADAARLARANEVLHAGLRRIRAGIAKPAAIARETIEEAARI